MYRPLFNRMTISLLPAWFTNYDEVPKDTKTVQSTDITIGKVETGMDRLRRMFSTGTDELDGVSPEINSIAFVGCWSGALGAFYGAFMNSRTTTADFMRDNQATIFKDPLEAKKRLQDKVTMAMGKGAFKWSWRLALFTTSYSGITTCISVYRGKSGIIEHVIAGTLTGMLYKFTMGPRGWLVGGGLGLVLGTVGGVMSHGILTLTGVSMDEVRYWNYRWKEDRDYKFNRAMYLARMSEGADQIIFEHEEKFGPAAKSLENLGTNEIK